MLRSMSDTGSAMCVAPTSVRASLAMPLARPERGARQDQTREGVVLSYPAIAVGSALAVARSIRVFGGNARPPTTQVDSACYEDRAGRWSWPRWPRSPTNPRIFLAVSWPAARRFRVYRGRAGDLSRRRRTAKGGAHVRSRGDGARAAGS